MNWIKTTATAFYRSEVKIDFGDYKSSINPPEHHSGFLGLGLPAGTGGRTENGSLTLSCQKCGNLRL
jgi:hypothetical protein